MNDTSRYTAKVIPVRRTIAPALVLGIGLGGLLDGIVLHQILQWHSMLSNLVPPVTLEAAHLNMFWDGIFHAATWLVIFAGVMLLWRSGQRGTNPRLRIFIGALLTGWAVFNLIEGLVDHHLLRLHNVREVADPAVWNVGFLAVSVVVLLIGLMLIYLMSDPDRMYTGRQKAESTLSVG